MQNLNVFFTNHFDTRRLGDDRVRKFTEDHLQRMANSGLYAQLVVDTQIAYTGYFGALTDEATRIAIREGLTMSVENAVEAIKKAVSQKEGAVRSAFGKDSPVYQEFLPQGVTEYAKANLSNIEEKVVRFIAAATTHKAEVPGLQAQFEALRDAFVNARNLQLQSKGEVSLDKVASSEKRDVVEIQLMKNVLTIALDHIGDPAGGLAYFDQSILHAPQAAEEPEPPTP